MEPWKLTSLRPPPVHTTEINGNFDFKTLKHICDSSITILSKQSPLHRESALLSRFLYKYDKKFRNDIGYRNIRKTNSTLRKYLQINLLKDLKNFIAVLPNEDDTHMPTRQMLEYVLVRIITFSKLMLRIYVLSKQAAVFYLDRVKRGESHWMSLMPYALLSRIWSICFVLLQHSTTWYSSLYPFLAQLQSKGLSFLPADYQLPHNLDEWLDLKNLDTFGKFHWSQKKPVELGVSLADDEDAFDFILDYSSRINEDDDEVSEDLSIKKEVKDIEQLLVPNVTKFDQGQAISRNSYKMMTETTETLSQNIMNQKQSQKPHQPEQTKSQECLTILTNFQKRISNENKGTHYFGRVTNLNTLKDFLVKEETFRNDGNQKSLTSHLSFMQWQTLKTALMKVCDSISNRKLDRKLQKVWKEKCLDYL